MKLHKNNLPLLTLLGSTVLSPFAFADDHKSCGEEGQASCYQPTGWYIGGAIGRTHSDINENDLPWAMDDGLVDFNEDGMGRTLFGGFQFTTNFALELGYLDLGGQSYVVTEPLAIAEATPTVDYPDAGKGFTFTALYSYPIAERLKVTAKAGLFRWDSEYSLASNNQVTKFEDSAIDVMFGIEGAFQVLPSTQVYLGYQQNKLEDQDIGMWSLGVRYYFDSGSQKPAKKVEKKAASAPVQTLVATNPVTTEADADGDGVADTQDICPNTPSTHLVDKQGCSQFEDENVAFDLTLYFANNSSTLEGNYQAKLSALKTFVTEHDIKVIEIIGHTSSVGSDVYNMSLSKKRAKAVAKELVSNYDFDKNMIVTIGKGESELIDLENDDNNRRIQINLLDVLSVPLLKK